MQQEQLTIVGRGASWYACPFEGEVWGTATCLGTEGMGDKRFDKVFAFDDEHYFLMKCLDIAKERAIPVVSTKRYATEKYPLVDIYNDFGKKARNASCWI